MSLNKSRTQEFRQPLFKKPKSLLDVTDKDDNYAYKWLSVRKLEQMGFTTPDGWQVVNALTSTDEGVQKEGGLQSKNPLDGSKRIGDLVLARMPKEQAEERNKYYRNINALNDELLRTRKDLRSDSSDIKPEVHAEVWKGGKRIVKED